MKFITDDPINYSTGKIVITQTELQRLADRGWIVKIHSPSYVSHIGTTIMGVQVGFGGWMDNLSIGVFQPDGINGLMEIKSQADLDAVIGFIDAAVKTQHIKIK